MTHVTRVEAWQSADGKIFMSMTAALEHAETLDKETMMSERYTVGNAGIKDGLTYLSDDHIVGTLNALQKIADGISTEQENVDAIKSALAEKVTDLEAATVINVRLLDRASEFKGRVAALEVQLRSKEVEVWEAHVSETEAIKDLNDVCADYSRLVMRAAAINLDKAKAACEGDEPEEETDG